MSSAAGQFSPLVEDRDDDAAVTIDKGKTQKYLSFIKQAFKTGASNAVSTALGALGVPNPGMFTSLYSAYSSARHAARLKELYEHAGYPCSCGRCEDALDFAIAQKQGKTASKAGDVVLGFVPHGGTAKSAVSALWDKFKTKPDWENTDSYWAVTIWGNAKPINAEIAENDDDGRFALLPFGQDTGSCKKAFAIVAELMGDYHETKSMARADAVTLHRFGIDMIKAKLRSS